MAAADYLGFEGFEQDIARFNYKYTRYIQYCTV
jgi:hypothetical protein